MTTILPLDLASVGALMGEPARASMLAALMGGQALTAGELAWQARITAQTASSHLAKLTEAGMLAIEKQGRHRCFRLASPLVAQLLETVMVVAAVQAPPRNRRPTRIDAAVRTARTCYDHLAGQLGVALADALVADGVLEWSGDGGVLTERGQERLDRLGLGIGGLQAGARRFCRPCLDWSERRHHVAGALGAALTSHFLTAGWLERIKDSRAVMVTAVGEQGFREWFGVEVQGSS